MNKNEKAREEANKRVKRSIDIVGRATHATTQSQSLLALLLVSFFFFLSFYSIDQLLPYRDP